MEVREAKVLVKRPWNSFLFSRNACYTSYKQSFHHQPLCLKVTKKKKPHLETRTALPLPVRMHWNWRLLPSVFRLHHASDYSRAGVVCVQWCRCVRVHVHVCVCVCGAGVIVGHGNEAVFMWQLPIWAGTLMASLFPGWADKVAGTAETESFHTSPSVQYDLRHTHTHTYTVHTLHIPAPDLTNVSVCLKTILMEIHLFIFLFDVHIVINVSNIKHKLTSDLIYILPHDIIAS